MSAGRRNPPALAGMLETCLYYSTAERDQVERFYLVTLGLRPVASWPDGIALRTGAGVLLVFDRELLAKRDGPIAAHGSTGPGHACLLAAGRQDYESWKDHLVSRGIEITHEHSWEGGRRSFYFADPAANLLEIADGDIWPAGV